MLNIKSIIKTVTPPFIIISFRYLIDHLFSKEENSDDLFNGDDQLFKSNIQSHSIYGEYGCGASTIWVAKNVGCEIFSVDSSTEWIDKVKNKCNGLYNINMHFSDLGPIGPWGRPINYDNSHNFDDYTDWIWRNETKPNVVLIDGRFRVCCFLTCLFYGNAETKIIFDDYTIRPLYHYVEKYVKPTSTFGRQALFIIPNKEFLDIDKIVQDIDKFRFVIE